MTANRAWTLDEEKELAGKLRLAVEQTELFTEQLRQLGYTVKMVNLDGTKTTVHIHKTQEVVL